MIFRKMQKGTFIPDHRLQIQTIEQSESKKHGNKNL